MKTIFYQKIFIYNSFENFNQLTNFNLKIILIFYDQIFIDRVLTLFYVCIYLFLFLIRNYKNFNILNSAIVLNFFLSLLSLYFNLEKYRTWI